MCERERETAADITAMHGIEGGLWKLLLARAPRVVAAVLGDDAAAHLNRLTTEERKLSYLRREDAWREWLRACVHKVRLASTAEQLAEAQRLRNRCVVRNMALVYHYARNLGTHSDIVQVDDMVNEGAIGLIRSVEAFDPTRGFTFGTYATWWIRHKILRCLQEQVHSVHVPVHIQELCHRQAKERTRLEGSLGRSPTEAELAAACCISEQQLALAGVAERSKHSYSLDAPLSDDGDSEASHLHAMPDQRALAAYGHMEAAWMLQDTMARMQGAGDARHMAILKARMAGETLDQIGKRYRISRERVRQLEVHAKKRLARMLNALPMYQMEGSAP